MIIIITAIFCVTCGFIMGFGIAVMLAAAGRESDAEALAEAQRETLRLRAQLPQENE